MYVLIIAAYAGTGKSYASQHLAGVLDMGIVPYKYEFPVGYDPVKYSEWDKANMEFALDWNYPEKYAHDLIENTKLYQHVMIPTDNRVMDILDREGIDYLLCYPEREAKEEYQKRYAERGNSETFLDIFIGRWDLWMDSFDKRQCKKYVMRQDEFLLDVLQSSVRCW